MIRLRALLTSMSGACVAFFVIAGTDAARAQSVPDGSAVAAILDAAEAECKAMDPDAPARLDLTPSAVSWTDLDGDEDRDDAIVDFNGVFCSVSAGLWAGTGGSPIHILQDAAAPVASSGTVWVGWGWQVVFHGAQPVVLLSRHGTHCGGSGSDPCVKAIVVSGAGVMTEVTEVTEHQAGNP